MWVMKFAITGIRCSGFKSKTATLQFGETAWPPHTSFHANGLSSCVLQCAFLRTGMSCHSVNVLGVMSLSVAALVFVVMLLVIIWGFLPSFEFYGHGWFESHWVSSKMTPCPLSLQKQSTSSFLTQDAYQWGRRETEAEAMGLIRKLAIFDTPWDSQEIIEADFPWGWRPCNCQRECQLRNCCDELWNDNSIYKGSRHASTY